MATVTNKRPAAKTPRAKKTEGHFEFEETQTIIVQHRPSREVAMQAMREIRAKMGKGTPGADICQDMQSFRDNPRA